MGSRHLPEIEVFQELIMTAGSLRITMAVCSKQ